MAKSNILYHGDNVDIFRRYIADEFVDLVYLDPPFRGDQNYNVLFKEQGGSKVLLAGGARVEMVDQKPALFSQAEAV
jgi:16S rRNA G966 N2-methylase RsmD